MNKQYILPTALAALLMLGISSCKTTEANYRAAYQIAKEKQLDGGDSTVTAGLKNEQLPHDLTVDGVTFPARAEPLAVVSGEGNTQMQLMVYNVVGASFRQLFNAQSFRDRLLALGYPAFLAKNRMGTFFVVAQTTKSPSEAHNIYVKLKSEKSLHFQPTFPYVLRAAQLVH